MGMSRFKNPQYAGNTVWAMPAESRLTWNGFADGGRHNAAAAIAPPELEYINKAIVGLTGATYDKAKEEWWPDMDDKIKQAKKFKAAEDLGIPITDADYYKNRLETTQDPEEKAWLKEMIEEHETFLEGSARKAGEWWNS